MNAPRGTRSILAALALLLSNCATAQPAGSPPPPSAPATPAAPALATPATPAPAATATPALPAGIQQVRFGAAVRDRSATGVARCSIAEPLPAPPRFEPDTMEIAYTIQVDPQAVKGVTAKVVGDLGCAEPWTQGCPGYTVCGGGVCQNQFGATVSCPGGKPLKKGSYQLSLKIGVDGPTVLLPFEIQ
jgi:hypothetical protein